MRGVMKGKDIKRYSLDEVRKIKGGTDWERLEASGDYQGQPEFEVDWSKAQLVEPQPKKLLSLRVDADVLDYFRAHGRGYQTRMNAVLRSYMEARKQSD
ncbi:MAG: BrnA antitoxin family protein [Silicimonas sp.]|jgi:uncharacterized protein (DUF4415 family)|nr:BrnA antitoxin family protein [Silicimonas sp.]